MLEVFIVFLCTVVVTPFLFTMTVGMRFRFMV